MAKEEPNPELDTVSTKSKGLGSLKNLGTAAVLSPSMRSGKTSATKVSSVKSKSIRLTTEEMKKSIDAALMKNRKPEFTQSKRNVLKPLTTLDPVNEEDDLVVNQMEAMHSADKD